MYLREITSDEMMSEYTFEKLFLKIDNLLDVVWDNLLDYDKEETKKDLIEILQKLENIIEKNN